MKRKILLILSFVPMLLFGQEISVDSLLKKVESIHLVCEQQSNKDKVKSYEQIFWLQDKVYNLMADSVKYFATFEKEAEAFRFFSLSDTTIFSDGYKIINTQKLPKYLQEHYLAVTMVHLYSQCIESIEEKIKSAKADKDIAEADRKKYIALKIKSEIDKADELLDKIEKVNMSTLSNEQSNFYQGLSKRLTNILNKYIF